MDIEQILTGGVVFKKASAGSGQKEDKVKTKAKKKTYITGLHGSGAAKMKADIRKKHGVTVLCIRRPDPKSPRKPSQVVIPGPNDAFQQDDKLIVFGTTPGIDAISSKE